MKKATPTSVEHLLDDLDVSDVLEDGRGVNVAATNDAGDDMLEAVARMMRARISDGTRQTHYRNIKRFVLFLFENSIKLRTETFTF